MEDDIQTILEKQIEKDLQQNRISMCTILGESVDIIERCFVLDMDTDHKGALYYVDGLVNNRIIETGILQPLQHHTVNLENMEQLQEQILRTTSGSIVTTYQEAVDGLFIGNTVLFLEGADQAVILNTIGGENRAIDEPSTEPVIRGPRDGFVENIRTNTALVRRRIRDPHFRLESTRVGAKSNTIINIAYIKGIVQDSLIEEIKARLDKIKIDGIIDSGYIEELIDDAPYSPFVTSQSTERPDKVAASLLEGRAAVFVDNSPFAIIIPATFWQFIQASDDYYSRYYVGSFFRLVRLAAFMISLTLPSLYVLVSSFHQEMVPTALALTIASGREVIPFPVLFEVLIMEFAFELMREAGLRMPRPIGSAVSIVGSLVIGQAAVQAGIVGPFAVIIVAVTGIASFAIPNYAISFSLRIVRFPILITSGTLGLLGFGGIVMLIIMHVLSLRSFGEPYLTPLSPFRPNEQKDIIIRVPWWKMKSRPRFAQDSKRQGDNAKPSKPDNDHN